MLKAMKKLTLQLMAMKTMIPLLIPWPYVARMSIVGHQCIAL
jgi:hypothetical protein